MSIDRESVSLEVLKKGSRELDKMKEDIVTIVSLVAGSVPRYHLGNSDPETDVAGWTGPGDTSWILSERRGQLSILVVSCNEGPLKIRTTLFWLGRPNFHHLKKEDIRTVFDGLDEFRKNMFQIFPEIFEWLAPIIVEGQR